VSAFVEIGPGTVLSGLMRRIHRGVPAYNVADTSTLEETLTALA